MWFRLTTHCPSCPFPISPVTATFCLSTVYCVLCWHYCRMPKEDRTDTWLYCINQMDLNFHTARAFILTELLPHMCSSITSLALQFLHLQYMYWINQCTKIFSKSGSILMLMSRWWNTNALTFGLLVNRMLLTLKSRVFIYPLLTWKNPLWNITALYNQRETENHILRFLYFCRISM